METDTTKRTWEEFWNKVPEPVLVILGFFCIPFTLVMAIGIPITIIRFIWSVLFGTSQ